MSFLDRPDGLMRGVHALQSLQPRRQSHCGLPPALPHRLGSVRQRTCTSTVHEACLLLVLSQLLSLAGSQAVFRVVMKDGEPAAKGVHFHLKPQQVGMSVVVRCISGFAAIVTRSGFGCFAELRDQGCCWPGQRPRPGCDHHSWSVSTHAAALCTLARLWLSDTGLRSCVHGQPASGHQGGCDAGWD